MSDTPAPVPSARSRAATPLAVLLTGGTGLIGSGVLRALLDRGHHVTALTRSAIAAEQVAAAGATPLRGDLTDVGLLRAVAAHADAVVHTGSPTDQTAPAVGAAVADAVLDALRGSGKAYVHTSGIWVWGSGDIDEETPFAPLPSTAWRLPVDARVRAAADQGVRSVVVAPGIVHGTGRGVPTLLRSAPRDGDGAVRLPGSGEQRWTSVHTADLGRLYAAALEQAPAGSFYVAASGDNPTVAEIAAAASRGAGGSGRVRPSTAAETDELFGPLARALCLDQRATGAKARQELGWRPTGPGLLHDLELGSYAAGSPAGGSAA